MSNSRTAAKSDRAEADNAIVNDVAKAMRSFGSLTRDVAVPQALLPALASGRPQLVFLVKPTDLPADEVAILYRLIGTLMETNAALQARAKRVAAISGEIAAHMRGFESTASKLREFAEFRMDEEDVNDPEVDSYAA